MPASGAPNGPITPRDLSPTRRSKARTAVLVFCPGAQVPLDVDDCPQCGARFTSVRCPRCDHEGSSVSFATGCPACGYRTPQQQRELAASAPVSRRSGTGTPRLVPNWVLVWLVGAAAVAAVILGVVTLAR